MEFNSTVRPADKFARATFRKNGLKVVSASVRKDGNGLTIFCRKGDSTAEVALHLMGKKVQTNVILQQEGMRPLSDQLRNTNLRTVQVSYNRRKARLERNGINPAEFVAPVYRSIHEIAKQYDL